jgi:heterodisulfide reductase subunit C2
MSKCTILAPGFLKSSLTENKIGMKNTELSTQEISLRQRVQRTLNLEVQSCYQCGKCTAGCPLNEEMAPMPHQILRLLQAEPPGYEDRILHSLSIWLCQGCETCLFRCPQQVDLPRIMDFLRQESLRLNTVHPKAKNILKFHQAFLSEVARSGKLNELPLTIDYKLRTMHLMQDIQNAPSMLIKGKLNIVPHHIQNLSGVKKLFNRISG